VCAGHGRREDRIVLPRAKSGTSAAKGRRRRGEQWDPPSSDGERAEGSPFRALRGSRGRGRRGRRRLESPLPHAPKKRVRPKRAERREPWKPRKTVPTGSVGTTPNGIRARRKKAAARATAIKMKKGGALPGWGQRLDRIPLEKVLAGRLRPASRARPHLRTSRTHPPTSS